MKKFSNMSKWARGLVLSLAVAASCGGYFMASASDHDDGEIDAKGRSLNLTDLYVFREDKEIAGGSANHLVFIVNTNPRSLPQQQYYFSTKARYDIHISRAGTSKAVPATTNDNIILRFQFGEPTAGVQKITLTTIIDGVSTVKTQTDAPADILTTTLAQGAAAAEVNNMVTVGGNQMTVFAGMREDPFFFDVLQFFNFRIAAAGTALGSYPVGYTAPKIYKNGATPMDFTSGYNVNSIAVRVPIAMLQTALAEDVFDVWTTISVPQ